MSIKYVPIIAIIFLFNFKQAAHMNDGINWPGLHCPGASGIADNYKTVRSWNIETSDNINWTCRIRGSGFPSPVIWEDRVFIAAAISRLDNSQLKVGNN